MLLAHLATSLLLALQDPGGASRWGAEYFPDVELLTHEGKSVRFFSDLVAGKVVVINFIYTSCADACPLETARLAEVREILGERVGQDVFMYSISIDPARDTVPVLAEYAERFQAGPGWLFLRGSEEDVSLLRKKLGLLGADEKELQDHSLNVVVGNQATGRWMRRSPFENSYVLANEIGSSLHNWKLPPPPIVEIDPASLGQISRGEQLFRTRCSACHQIGGGDGLARLGPNLQGVVQWRDPAWLRRWIAEPDKVLAEGDPLALTLFEAYRRVPMPNMRLNELEVEALIEFIDEESQRTLAEGPPAAVPAAPAGEAPGCCEKEDTLVLGEHEEHADHDAPQGWELSPPVGDEDEDWDSSAAPVGSAPVTPPAGASFLGLGLLFALGGLASALIRQARS